MNIEYDNYGNAEFDGMSLSADEAAELENILSGIFKD